MCRHTAAPLVCRRWRQLVQFEPLLQEVQMVFDTDRQLPRLRSVCEWVLTHASQHMQQLDLAVFTDEKEAAEESAKLLAASLAA